MLNYYNRNAAYLSRTYLSLDPEVLHAGWIDYLPHKPGLALDIGAGSGRDAAWLARKGWEVIAVEPAGGLRAFGQKATDSLTVSWVNDCLPYLPGLQAYRQRFSFILAAGVLMHLPPRQRRDSLETLAGLLAAEAVMIVTLRYGPNIDGRMFYEVPVEEIAQFAQGKAFHAEVKAVQADRFDREGVRWQTIIVKKSAF